MLDIVFIIFLMNIHNGNVQFFNICMYSIIYNLKIIAISVHTNNYLVFNIFIEYKETQGFMFLHSFS